MVGSVARGESDVAIGALSISDDRQAVVDFSIPWLYHGIGILEKIVCSTNFSQNSKWKEVNNVAAISNSCIC